MSALTALMGFVTGIIAGILTLRYYGEHDQIWKLWAVVMIGSWIAATGNAIAAARESGQS